MPNPKDVLYHAAQLKIQLKKLEEEYELLKPQIEQAVVEVAEAQGAEKEEVTVGELGKFCRVKGPTKWVYSKPTQALKKQLDEIQKDEQANGKAKGEPTFQIKFMENKPDA